MTDGAAAPPPMTLARPMRRLIFVAFSKLPPRNVDNKPLRLRSVSKACVVGDKDSAAACGFSGAIGVGALGARVEKTLLMQNLLYIIIRLHYIYKVETKQEKLKECGTREADHKVGLVVWVGLHGAGLIHLLIPGLAAFFFNSFLADILSCIANGGHDILVELVLGLPSGELAEFSQCIHTIVVIK